jgi:hypothetical protein
MMTSADFGADVPVSQYGRARREAWLAGIQVNSDNMTQAAMEAHRADHDVITRTTHGLYGALSPQERAVSVAGRQATVSTDYGDGRPLQRNGGLYGNNIGPAPARVYRQDLTAQPGESPLARWLRERQ